MRGQAFVAAAAIALALAGVGQQPAAAQQYSNYHDAHVANEQQCRASRNNRAVGGAVIGRLRAGEESGLPSGPRGTKSGRREGALPWARMWDGYRAWEVPVGTRTQPPEAGEYTGPRPPSPPGIRPARPPFRHPIPSRFRNAAAVASALATLYDAVG